MRKVDIAIVATIVLAVGVAVGLALFSCGTEKPRGAVREYTTEEGLSAEIMPIFIMPKDEPILTNLQLVVDSLQICGAGSHMAVCGSGSYAGRGYIVSVVGCGTSYAAPMNERELGTFCSARGGI